MVSFAEVQYCIYAGMVGQKKSQIMLMEYMNGSLESLHNGSDLPRNSEQFISIFDQQ